MRQHPNGVEVRSIRPAATRELLERLDHIRSARVIDRLGTGVLAREREPLGHAVNGDHAVGPERGRRSGSRSGRPVRGPDGDDIARPNTALLCGLVPRWQNVRQENDLLVLEAIWHLHRPDVGIRHPDILGLSTGVAAIQRANTRTAPAPEKPYAASTTAAFGLELSHIAHRPRVVSQWPQSMPNGTTTRSPCRRLFTAGPGLDDLAHALVAEDVAGFQSRCTRRTCAGRTRRSPSS